MALLQVPEKEDGYPDPHMFGPLPAHGFYLRHVNNIELTNVEIAYSSPDMRPAFVLDDVKDADFFRIKVPVDSRAPLFRLNRVSGFRVFGSPKIKGRTVESAASEQF